MFLFPNHIKLSIELKFTLHGVNIGVSDMSFPYLPPLDSAEGQKLVDFFHSVGQSPLIAHQLCALQIFQARMNKNRFLLMLFNA